MKGIYSYSKKLLKKAFLESIKKQANKSDKKYFQIKYKHAFQTAHLAKKIFSIDKEYTSLYLLHDIGRFLLPLENQEKHAVCGYNFLKNINAYPPEILLPILFHETDTDWENKLNQLKDYQILSEHEKEIVQLNIKRLKDADIIANMFERLTNYKTDGNISETAINCLLNNKICDKDFSGSINRSLYIICGAYLLSTNEGLAFIKQSGLIGKYFKKIIKKVKDKTLQSQLQICKEHLIDKCFI